VDIAADGFPDPTGGQENGQKGDVAAPDIQYPGILGDVPLDVIERTDMGACRNQSAQQPGFIVVQIEEEPAQVGPAEAE
jgi:hypothetical protein